MSNPANDTESIDPDACDGDSSAPDGLIGGPSRAPDRVPQFVSERLATLDVASLDDEESLLLAAECERAVAFLHATQLRALARLAQLRPAEDRRKRFSEFAADEVAPALGWTRRVAAERLTQAIELTGRLSPALRALERGDVDLYKTQILTRLTAPLSDDQAAFVAGHTVAGAAGQNATTFRRSVRCEVLRVDPAGQDRRHEVARAGRKVVLAALPDGMAELTATLPADRATAIYQLVDTIARNTGVPDDGRSPDACRADAFTELLLRAGLNDGSGGSLRPLVQVTVAATTLAEVDNEPADLAGYGPIPAGMARRIAADPTGTWRRLLTDPVDGTLLDHGRRTYRPPAPLADHVTARDVTCRFPGCHHQAQNSDIDHTVPYPTGPTAAGNLGALCRHHRRLKHQRIWTLSQHDGHFVWTSPTGRRYTVAPATYSAMNQASKAS